MNAPRWTFTKGVRASTCLVCLDREKCEGLIFDGPHPIAPNVTWVRFVCGACATELRMALVEEGIEYRFDSREEFRKALAAIEQEASATPCGKCGMHVLSAIHGPEDQGPTLKHEFVLAKDDQKKEKRSAPTAGGLQTPPPVGLSEWPRCANCSEFAREGERTCGRPDCLAFVGFVESAARMAETRGAQ